MNNTLLSPDGIVKGSIHNQAGTKADIWLNLSLYKAAPTGAFYSTILNQDISHLVNIYSISSNCPVQIKTLQTDGSKSIKANFANTIIYNPETNKLTTTCRALFTATQTKPGIWTGALTVVYPDGRKLTVYGNFSGTVTVNRQVEGSRTVL